MEQRNKGNEIRTKFESDKLILEVHEERISGRVVMDGAVEPLHDWHGCRLTRLAQNDPRARWGSCVSY